MHRRAFVFAAAMIERGERVGAKEPHWVRTQRQSPR